MAPSSLAPTVQTLEVPGARLYYEVRGQGPLVVLAGAPMDAGPFGPLAELLAADYTVLTTDPRGGLALGGRAGRGRYRRGVRGPGLRPHLPGAGGGAGYRADDVPWWAHGVRRGSSWVRRPAAFGPAGGLTGGTFRWITPAGRSYDTEPTRYPI